MQGSCKQRITEERVSSRKKRFAHKKCPAVHAGHLGVCSEKREVFYFFTSSRT